MKLYFKMIFACLPLLFVGAAFTDFTPGGVDMQALANINQIRTTMREHQLSVRQTPVTNLVAGDDVHSGTITSDPLADTNWVRAAQLWADGNVAKFINHTLYTGITDFAGVKVVTNWTLTSWRNAAGITNSWRRALTFDPTTNDWNNYNDFMFTNVARGRFNVGDIWGPWLFDDLQKGFSLFRWTFSSNAFSQVNTLTNFSWDTSEARATCAAALLAQSASWAATNWVQGGASLYYSVERSHAEGAGDPRVTGFRERSHPAWKSVPTNDIPYLWHVYMTPTRTEWDPDGTGLTDKDVFNSWDSGSGTAGLTNINAKEIGSEAQNENPPEIAPAWACPLPDPTNDVMRIGPAHWIIDWTYSFENP